jgi:hypothetical protein
MNSAIARKLHDHLPFSSCDVFTGAIYESSMLDIITNLVIAVLTIAVLLLAIYGVLSLLEWGLQIKSRGREQAGLIRLWSAAQKHTPKGAPDKSTHDDERR